MDYRKRALELEKQEVDRHEIVEILNEEGYTNTKGEPITYEALRKALQPSRLHQIVGETTKEGKEEKKPTIIDNGDYYTVHNHNHKRVVNISKIKFKELKELYCSGKLTINQVCYKLDIPRRDFILIKTAFDITKDDVPFIDEELVTKSTEELVNETLEKKKEQYFIKLQQEEIGQLRKEVDQYRKQDYFIDKIIDRANIPVKSMNFNIQKIQSNTEGLLTLADWHTGLETSSYWNKYNSQVQEERINELVSRTVNYIHRHKVKKLHVMALGDLINGLIHTTTRLSNEIDVDQQVVKTVFMLSDILETLAKEVELIEFSNTHGNHGRMIANKKDSKDAENYERIFPPMLQKILKNFNNIKFIENKIDPAIIKTTICNKVILGTHGDKDKLKNIAKDMSMMIEKPYKIYIGHGHHFEQLEEHGVDVRMSRSLSGVDSFAKDIRKTSTPGQGLDIYNEKGLECTYDITF